MDEPTKRCASCKKTLPLSGFNRYRASPDGHRYSCRECDKAYREASRDERYRPCTRCKTPTRAGDLRKLPGFSGFMCQACSDKEDTRRVCRGCGEEHRVVDFRPVPGLSRMRCRACADVIAAAYWNPQCSSCDETYPREEFVVRGLKTPTCRICREIRDREHAIDVVPYQSRHVEYHMGSNGWRRLEDEARAKTEAAIAALRASREEVLGR
jgi:hypothetical protein